MEERESNEHDSDKPKGWLFEQDRLFKQIGVCLDTLAVPKHLLGYRYIQCAAEFVIRQTNPIKLGMMKDIYPYVAEQMHTSPVMVDRAMRHAIEVSWNRGSVRLQRMVFGYCAFDKRGMPINAEFIYAVVDHLRPLLLTEEDDIEFAKRIKRIEDSLDKV